ncbi:hypothetical protein SAMN05192574_12166 [Mucilaginibacter gossypiicola]|uniref:TIR domain-containing protein n=1 Tax=Mucilaginibacter gossypiicola TaxID=551995 RepID=A0A1H8V0T3_9SPHI|nr:hypothetical protein [Mucilaginibacter gossypiicola]SEP08837.1 hypothetical protein SAMN05192574_12166 [Mucilaginibacter gossypiicola]
MAIILQSQLRQFRNTVRPTNLSVNESLNSFRSESKQDKVTIFLSHKHDEAENLDSAINLLKRFRVNVYVDWLDEGMPKSTSGITALRIKKKIKENKKFIFLATEGAIASKWCNWELGYGDSLKYIDNIALFPIKNDYSTYSGSEYMQIYPSIEYEDGRDKNTDGDYISEGYYVFFPADNKGSRKYITLGAWLAR